MKITIKKEDLCKCDSESFPHVNHQLCQSCKRRVPVPVPLSLGAFCNSTSWCEKCPEGSSGRRLREMFNTPHTIEII